MKKVLVLGATGMLGHACSNVIGKNGTLDVVKTSRSAKAGYLKFDASHDSIKDLISTVNPDWVVNCIGIIKPHIDEKVLTSINQAIRINALFPQEIASATNRPVIQIATDCVYSGNIGAYPESALHDATDVYGKTKSLGEIPAENLKHIRASIIGPEEGRSTSLLEWFKNQPKNAKLNGFTDHLWNGVTTHHFGYLAKAMIENDFLDFNKIHFVPGDVVTKAELLRIFASSYNRSDIIINDVESTKTIDRTLATENLEMNSTLWKLAGYDSPPTIKQMVEEQSKF
jgi:dTDP-4-dehydrorhamnose reductase